MKYKFDGIVRYKPFVKKFNTVTWNQNPWYNISQQVISKKIYGTDEQRKELAKKLWNERKVRRFLNKFDKQIHE